MARLIIMLRGHSVDQFVVSLLKFGAVACEALIPSFGTGEFFAPSKSGKTPNKSPEPTLGAVMVFALVLSCRLPVGGVAHLRSSVDSRSVGRAT